MKPDYDHTALIVDDDENTVQIMARILQELNVTAHSAPDGETALEKLSGAGKPYTLVISDQWMPGMRGHEFLEQVSRLSPDTFRFLMSGYTDMNAIINAVNRGAITRFIEKPWDNDALAATLRACIRDFEEIMENRSLFSLAKIQNARLFEMNKFLKKETETYECRLSRIHQEIALLNMEIDSLKNKDQLFEKILSHVEQVLSERRMLNQDAFNAFAAHVMNELFDQFKDIVVRNGFKMPEGLR